MPYEPHDWPMIPGRGEFVRLALEEAGADYVEVARLDDEAGGIGPMLARLCDPTILRSPDLSDSAMMFGQLSAILLDLGPHFRPALVAGSDPV